MFAVAALIGGVGIAFSAGMIWSENQAFKELMRSEISSVKEQISRYNTLLEKRMEATEATIAAIAGRLDLQQGAPPIRRSGPPAATPKPKPATSSW
jgi:hypothetical protein